MLELLMTLTDNTLPIDQELVATNYAGQPSSVGVNWCRGIGTRSHLIYLLSTAVTGGKSNLYVYNITFGTWADLGPTTATFTRLGWSPTLAARTQDLLVYMALDEVYFYDIATNIWTKKATIATNQPGYMYGTKGWVYGGIIYRYGVCNDTFGNVTIMVQAYDTSIDKHTAIFTNSTNNASKNRYASTILVGSRLYLFALDGVVSYYDFVVPRKIVYTTVSIPMTSYNTLVEYNGNILIFGDNNNGNIVRLFNTTTNTVTIIPNPTIVSTMREFGFTDAANVPTVYVSDRAKPSEYSFLKYHI